MERTYESMVIIREDLDDKELEKIFGKISKKIEELGGKLIENKIWAKERVFAYPLRSQGADKKKYNRGLYWLIVFNLDNNKLGNLKETIRLEENILRSLIIRRSKV
ncbi:MAG: 30S ribosomal protein S6 [Candidatus Omnitrophica bacterium]|nr:30S ribosomal protein S6 [Candidatus Omnitrophota bacterium]MCM8826191.1 30S ribosomal protein S6 [Candidatus Omnitrophota bacterium]